MKYIVRQYKPSDAPAWNTFIADACNATFLFNRGFMDYHADRFADFSLIVERDGAWAAVLPAHRSGSTVASHFGLTYGGLVYKAEMKLVELVVILREILFFLAREDVDTLRIKTMPPIYHKRPAEELHYALFLANATLERRDALSVIDREAGFKISRKRKQSIRRGNRNHLEVREEANFESFWNTILIPNLARKHQASPVHSLEEIQLLHRRFPDHIRHFNVYEGDRIVAGTTVFIAGAVAHPQYVSGKEDKNALGSLDFLYHHLINKVFVNHRFFDFGISHEQQGRKINEGLIFWKESFGAGTIVQDFYSVPTANFNLLEDFLL